MPTATSSLYQLLQVADNYIDFLTIIITIIIAISGWIIGLLIQKDILKQKHKIDIRYDIYKQFVVLHKKIEKNLHQFSAYTIDPFLMMKGSMIPSTIKILNKTTSDCLQDANKIWTNFYEKLQTNYFQFSDDYIDMLYLFEDWNAPLKKLLSTTETYSQTVSHLQNEIYKNLTELQLYQSRHGYDWQNWDQTEIKGTLDSMKSSILDISYYTVDLMVLIHNELLGEHFAKRKPSRKTTSKEYKVLTKKGISVRLDKPRIKKYKANKKEMITMIDQKFETEATTLTPDDIKSLELLKKGTCPDCKNKIDVYSVGKLDGSIFFKFTCGHKWTTVLNKNKLGIKKHVLTKLFKRA